MRKVFGILSIWIFIFIGIVQVSAAENEFKKNNPDGDKYEFARSYISALRYFHEISNRWEKNPPKKKFADDEAKMISGNIQYLVLDNSNLRISKKYMENYIDSPNKLIRKAADIVIVACTKDIALNDQSKALWQKWLSFKIKKKPSAQEEKEFVNAQRAIELQRKESDKTIIKASFLVTKILLSQENKNDKGKLLAITEKQRSLLIDNLDVYGKDVMDWEVKPGQSTLEASIAVLREVLEDSVYIAQK